MNSEHREYRAGLYERKNNRTGATEWCVRFTHPSAPTDASKVAWFDVPVGNSYFPDAEDRKWFLAFVEHRRNIAVKFHTMHDAFGFLERLRPAEIPDDAQGSARAA